MDIGGDSNHSSPASDIDQHEASQEVLDLSDVIDAVKIADPSFDDGAGTMYHNAHGLPAGHAYMMVGADQPPAPARPFVRIVEQPASKALRFRYECEGRSAGSIPGASSTPERKTYPAIEVVNYRGPVVVVVSCVTKDEPYCVHPHNLVGREGCKKGVFTMPYNTTDNPVIRFSNLGIQCVKRKDIDRALQERELIKIDPFDNKFHHRKNPQSIDLNAVRLAFQVFIKTGDSTNPRTPLPAVASEVIYDKKAMSDLLITKLSDCTTPMSGMKDVILLCEKVTREDIEVWFFECDKDSARIEWEAKADVQLVHKQVAIVFKTPPYQNPSHPVDVKVYIQLRRQSDNSRSEPYMFEYIAKSPEPDELEIRKRKRLFTLMQNYENIPGKPEIKVEPNNTPPPSQFSPGMDPSAQQWQYNEAAAPGPSHGFQQPSKMQWAATATAQYMSPTYQQSPSYQMSPNYQMSPHHQQMSPHHQQMSPHHQQMSPHHQQMSPHHQQVSPHPSPMHMQASPGPALGHVSPGLPGVGHVSPHLIHQADVMIEHQRQERVLLEQQQMMEQSANDSLSNLLNNLPEGRDVQMSSGDLSGLVSLLAEARSTELSDSLTTIPTRDLLR